MTSHECFDKEIIILRESIFLSDFFFKWGSYLPLLLMFVSEKIEFPKAEIILWP